MRKFQAAHITCGNLTKSLSIRIINKNVFCSWFPYEFHNSNQPEPLKNQNHWKEARKGPKKREKNLTKYQRKYSNEILQIENDKRATKSKREWTEKKL